MLLADGIDDVDFTGGKTLLELAQELQGRGVVVAFANVLPDVRAELDRFGVTAVVGEQRFFATVADARAAFAADAPRA
ncbi:MAG: sodium-independent anion transporter [Gaiella sp.]